jgi:hypothetical protein
MTAYRSPVSTAVPLPLEKRLEIIEAIRALAASDDEQVHKRRADIAALRRDLENLKEIIADLWRLCETGTRSQLTCSPLLPPQEG